jgi:hypothetical protein
MDMALAAEHHAQVPAWAWSNHEWASVVLIFTETVLAGKNIIAKYVDFNNQRIDWDAIAEAAGPWSRSERLMVSVAWSLWGGTRDLQYISPFVNPRDIVGGLDSHSFPVVMEAIQRARP